MRTLVIIAILFLIAPVFANQEEIARWKSITITTHPMNEFPETKVTIETERERFTRIHVVNSKFDLELPSYAFEDLNMLSLDGIQISSDSNGHTTKRSRIVRTR